MRMHVLQHVPFEGPAGIALWAARRGHTLRTTRLYREEPFPREDAFDWLVIMGGPMGVHDEDAFPWLAHEKRAIARAIARGKKVLGICLGAQLIAHALGGRILKNRHREIGWFPVSLTPESGQSRCFKAFPKSFTAFHWHGDTFERIPGCVHAMKSAACAHQSFEYDGRIVGLQFHVEVSLPEVKKIIRHCSEECTPGPYVQRPQEMVSLARTTDMKDLLCKFLDSMVK